MNLVIIIVLQDALLMHQRLLFRLRQRPWTLLRSIRSLTPTHISGVRGLRATEKMLIPSRSWCADVSVALSTTRLQCRDTSHTACGLRPAALADLTLTSGTEKY